MFNAYAIILVLFIVAGLVTAIWGAVMIARARKSLSWPETSGVIEQSDLASATDDLLPNIRYAYIVDGARLSTVLRFPGGTTPSRELAEHYVARYPLGRRVAVYYDPADPQRSTLEPGPAQGDWLICFIGAAMVLLGIIFLLV
jgi:hypothetical protein